MNTPTCDSSLYPFTLRTHATPDGVTRYVDVGSGSPVVLVHGTPSWSFEWRSAIVVLARDHRVIAPDHLGFGLSDKPPGAPYRVVDHTRRLRSLLDSLDLDDVTLVVHDFGGPIALPLATDPRVTRVVVMNTWAWPLEDRRMRRVSRFAGTWLGRFLYLRLNASPRWLVPMSFADRRRLTRHVHRHYLAPFATKADRYAPWTLATELAGADDSYTSLWESRAAWLSKVTTIIWGTRDPALGTELLARWRSAAPHARVTLTDAGHFPQEETPDAVSEALMAAGQRISTSLQSA